MVGRRKYFLNSTQLDWLKDNYPTMGQIKCAEYLNISKSALCRLTKKLGIKISKERWDMLQKEKWQKSIITNRKYFLEGERLEWFKNNYPTLGGQECSKKLNIPNKALNNMAIRYGIKVSKETLAKQWSQKQTIGIILRQKYFLEGEKLEWFKNNCPMLGCKKCSIILNLPRQFLYEMARKLKITINEEAKIKIRESRSKEQSERSIIQFAKRQEKLIEDAKKITIDCPEKAYTLGFLWGDGYLRHQSKCYYPSLEIVRNDLDEIINFLKCWEKWHVYYRKSKYRQEQGAICWCNGTFGWFLKTHDYKHKSVVAPSKILSIIPNNLKSYWWRGYVDADGCFYVHQKNRITQFSLAGSFEQEWSEIEKLCSELGIVKYKICRRIHKNQKDRDSMVLITNRKDISKLGEYIYNGNFDMKLKRKYDKYSLIKNMFENPLRMSKQK